MWRVQSYREREKRREAKHFTRYHQMMKGLESFFWFCFVSVYFNWHFSIRCIENLLTNGYEQKHWREGIIRLLPVDQLAQGDWMGFRCVHPSLSAFHSGARESSTEVATMQIYSLNFDLVDSKINVLTNEKFSMEFSWLIFEKFFFYQR